MEHALFAAIFWILIFVLIYRKIKAHMRSGRGYPETKSLEIKKRFNHTQNVKTSSNTRWSTETNTRELHGHRCYIDELTSYEYALVKHLAEHLDPRDYYIFNNITVPSSVTVTSQIDHIIVSKYGIFVIENKDFSGWIFGHKNQKKWTQVVKGGEKFHFQNPILQNFAHVSALKEQMPFLRKSFYSVIVFSENSEFKTEMPPHVMHGEDLIDYILSKKNVLVSEGEILMAIGKLSVLCQTIQVTNKQHVDNLKTLHSLTPIPLCSKDDMKISRTE